MLIKFHDLVFMVLFFLTKLNKLKGLLLCIILPGAELEMGIKDQQKHGELHKKIILLLIVACSVLVVIVFLSLLCCFVYYRKSCQKKKAAYCSGA